MGIEKLTDIEKEKLINSKIPYRNTMTMMLSIIVLLSLMIIGIYFVGIYDESFLFRTLKLHWIFPLISVIAVILFYKIRVRAIDLDLKRETKNIKDFIIESKGSKKTGTYSTGDYRSSGSSEQLYIGFDNYSYSCSKDDFDKFNIGDKIKVAIAENSKIILGVINASAQQPV